MITENNNPYTNYNNFNNQNAGYQYQHTGFIGAPQQEKTTKFSIRELLFKYLAYLPLFLLSIAVFTGGGYLYIRYTVPKYKAVANMYIRTGDDVVTNNSGVNNSGNNDFISSALFGGKKVNIDNEIEKIKSKDFIKNVVIKHGFNINYYNEGKIKRSDIYNTAPFQLIVLNATDSTSSFAFYVKTVTPQTAVIYSSQKNPSAEALNYKWGDTIFYKNNRIVLEPKQNNRTVGLADDPYFAQYNTPLAEANDIKGRLTVSPYTGKTTILQFSLICENPNEGADIVNALIEDYAQKNIDDKNIAAQKTINFINDRVEFVSKEFNNILDEDLDYKKQQNIFDISKESGFYLENTFANEKQIQEIDRNLMTLYLIENYVSNSHNKDSLVPTALGITDVTLLSLVSKYNQVQLEKAPLTKEVVPKNNLQLRSLDVQLTDIRKSILESIKNIRAAVQTQKNNLLGKNREFRNYLAVIPEKQRKINDYTRQENIKNLLLQFLMQKREETAVASSSTVSDYQALDKAEINLKPFEPNVGSIKMFSVVLGFLLPIFIVYILYLFNDKLVVREDITRKTTIPIVGEISHIDRSMNTIVVGQSRNMIAEQFRILRTNMQFLLKGNTDKTKIFLVTSSISGEGKSFISINLACILSLSGKKVALLEFDLRKMRSVIYNGERQNNKGITNYLIGQTNDIDEMISTVDKFPELHIYRSGPIPPNPAELVMHERVKQLLEILKEKYDYIIIDSAPVGLVSDSFALTNYCHVTLYVLRQRYTFKKQIEFADDLHTQGKLANTAIVVNDVILGGKYGYYGYGYGYGYGYIYRYGFGYKYGYGYGNYAGKYFKKGAEGYFDLPKKK